MSMNTAAAYGIYPRNVALPEVVGALNSAGYGKEDICMVLSPAHPDAAAVRDANVLDAGRDDSTLSTRMIAWFSGFGAVVIPTVGFFVRSQPFLQALFADQSVSSLSRGSHTLVGLGFSQDDAKRLDHQLCDVGAMVYVACRERSHADVIELLRSLGAREAASLRNWKAASVTA